MENLTATLCLTLTVLLGSAGISWSADFQNGMTAYETGDYATALREWTQLAQKGVVPGVAAAFLTSAFLNSPDGGGA
jgi:hypothetical protein